VQQPPVSPKPKSVGEPVKSLSSHVMKMTELPFHAGDAWMAPTVSRRNWSPAEMSPWTCEKSQGSAVPPPPRPCMSWH